jgi:glucose-6-phosphate isomerase
MSYIHKIDGCFADKIGDGGVSTAGFNRRRTEAVEALTRIKESTDRQYMTVLKLPERRNDIDTLQQAAKRLRETCSDILVVGTGGSSLGARTLCALQTTSEPTLHFLENVDPHGVDSLLASLTPEETGTLFVSKSGGTLETIALTMVVQRWLLDRSGPEALSRRSFAIVERGDNPLHRLAQRYDIPVIAHDPYVGGRYSVFSSVGLLPAMIAGLDPIAIREGAQDLVAKSLTAPKNAAPVEGAALAAVLADERDISISVLMPYRDRLSNLALWYRQLWAESLGKNGKGTTPVHASGTVDQHSQLQLYLDGPSDKVITLVTSPAAGNGMIISPVIARDAGLDHLAGRSVGDLLDASSDATAKALTNQGRPMREIRIPQLNEFALGGLMMHFVLETLLTADLWKIDPFGQPAVESGKVLARKRLADTQGSAA